jgi:hypothetical protein
MIGTVMLRDSANDTIGIADVLWEVDSPFTMQTKQGKCLEKMAPGEGSPHSCGAKWLIPNAFGTLPALHQKLDVSPAFLGFDLFFSLHRFRAGIKLLGVDTSPWPFIALCVSCPMVSGIVMLKNSAIDIIGIANVVL